MNKALEILNRNQKIAMTERERNRKIINEWNPEILNFMDEFKEEFNATLKTIYCEIPHETDNTGKSNCTS